MSPPPHNPNYEPCPRCGQVVCTIRKNIHKPSDSERWYTSFQCDRFTLRRMRRILTGPR